MVTALAFLSDDWLAALAQCATEPGPEPLVVQQLVDRPEGVAAYWLEVGELGVGVGLGEASDPAVVFRCSERIAAEIHAGECSALRAFLNKDLELSGRVDALTSMQRHLDGQPDPFGELRTRTRYR